MLSRLFGGRLALKADQVNSLLIDLLDALQPVERRLFFVRVVGGVINCGNSRLFILLLMPMVTVG